MEQNVEIKKLWNFIEQQLEDCIFPTYLKNLLFFCGYDNIFSLKTLTNAEINEMQQFARTTMKECISEGAALNEYYHIFAATPEKFVILPGHLKLLHEIIKIVNSEDFKIAYSNFRRARSLARAEAQFAVHNRTVTAAVIETDAQESQLQPDDSIAKSYMAKGQLNLFQKSSAWLQKNATLSKDSSEFNLNMIDMFMERDMKTNFTKLAAKIKCPVCNKAVKASEMKKSLVGGNVSVHLSISNFTKHFREKHMNELKKNLKCIESRSESDETCHRSNSPWKHEDTSQSSAQKSNNSDVVDFVNENLNISFEIFEEIVCTGNTSKCFSTNRLLDQSNAIDERNEGEEIVSVNNEENVLQEIIDKCSLAQPEILNKIDSVEVVVINENMNFIGNNNKLNIDLVTQDTTEKTVLDTIGKELEELHKNEQVEEINPEIVMKRKRISRPRVVIEEVKSRVNNRKILRE